MKKALFIALAMIALTFASCGNKTENAAAVDTLAVDTDTVMVDTMAVDSVAMVADTVAVDTAVVAE